MKRYSLLLMLLAISVCGFAQEPVLNYSGEISFIPGAMTKSGEPFMVSRGGGIYTIYDGDFKVVKSLDLSTEGTPYQWRNVTYTRLCDPETKELLTDWSIEDDQTYDAVYNPSVSSFEVYSDDNAYHSRWLYFSQTLFDDDEEFEYLSSKAEIIPIDVKYSDYAKEHSSGGDGPIYSNPEDWWTEFGADGASWYYDSERGKEMVRLIKTEQYGGTFSEGLEITTLDGKVKGKLNGISYISTAYFFRGNCYIEGYNYKDNTNVLYRIGSSATNIEEVRRTAAEMSVKRVGNDLIVESNTNEQQTIVMSTMDGRVVRSLTAKQGNNAISLGGLMGGVYNVTLYRHSQPVKSTKIIIK